MRALLRLPGRPALLQLHHHRWWHPPAPGASGGADGPLQGGLFYETPTEQQLGVFAQVCVCVWGGGGSKLGACVPPS